MSDIEELVGRVMAENGEEAPRAGDLLRALAGAEAPAETWSWRRRRGRLAARGRAARANRAGWLLPAAAGIAVGAVMVGSAWAGGLIGGRNAPPAPIPQTTPPADPSSPPRAPAPPPPVPPRPPHT